MKFSFIGGDMRAVNVASSLARDGHEVSCFALENAPGISTEHMAQSLESCAAGADCVVLPLPVINSMGKLKAPMSDLNLGIGTVLRALPKDAVVCGGNAGAGLLALVEKLDLDFTDYFAREELVTLNALVTAEGALSLILRNSPRTIWDSRVLVVGFGRIGSMLAVRLRALGAVVSVSARSAGDMARIRAMGCEALDTRTLGPELGRFHTIVNTVPAQVLGRPQLRHMDPGVLCLDLASRPGGVDMESARELDRNVIWALGLPAETAPYTAGKIIKEALMNIMREKRGEIA